MKLEELISTTREALSVQHVVGEVPMGQVVVLALVVARARVHR